MKNLSVVFPESNKRFIDSLLYETGNEISFDAKDDLITVYDINDKNTDKFCSLLAKIIVKQYEKELLVKAINKRCQSFSKVEKIEIWKIAMSHLYEDYCTNNTDYQDRVNLVKKSISEFFKESNCLSLQGLVNFRLSEYLESLEDLAEFSATEYKIDCEYREFVMLLKCFVSLQPPKYNNVRIFYGKDVLIFGDGVNVTEEYEKEYRSEMGGTALNIDDFVLNSLILIAPKKIKLIITDVSPEKEFIDTLKSVFDNRISIN